MTGFYEHWTGIPGADEMHARHQMHAVAAAGHRPKPPQPDLTDPAFIAAVYAHWNGPAIRLPQVNAKK